MQETQPELEATPREDDDSTPNQLRRNAQIPGVVYGNGIESVSLKVDKNDIKPLIQQGSLSNRVIELRLDGEDEPRDVLIKDIQVDPVEDHLIHVDFQQVQPDDKVQVKVPVELIGQSPGVEFDNGIIDRPLRNLEVECKVEDIPDKIEVDIGELEIGDGIFVSELDVASGLKLLDHPERAVVTIQPPKEFDLEPEPAAETEIIEETVEEAMEEAVEEGEVPEEVEGEEGEAPAEEGEAAEEVPGEEPQEPASDEDFEDDL